MEKYKVVKELTLSDFEQMEEIEQYYFPKENITPAKEVWKWYVKNPDTCIAIINEKSQMIGSCTVLPLKRNVIEGIIKNTIDEAKLTDEQIEAYEEGSSYGWYLSAISVHPAYRNQIGILKLFFKAVLQLLDKLEEQNIEIYQIMAEASTKHGENICTKLLKMQFRGAMPDGSKIYSIEKEDKTQLVQHISKLIKERK